MRTASSARFSASKSSRISPARSAREAQRILDGSSPRNCPTHPPGYPFVVALGRVLSGEWLDAALWISGISAAVVLIASDCDLPQACGNGCVLGRAPGMRLFNTVPGVRIHRLERHVLCCPGLRSCLSWSSRTGGPAPPAALERLWSDCRVRAPDSQQWHGCRRRARAALAGSVARGEPRAQLCGTGWRFPVAVGGVDRCTPPARIRRGGPPATTGISRLRHSLGGPAGGTKELPRCRPTFTNFADVLAYDPVRLVSRLATNLALLPAKARADAHLDSARRTGRTGPGALCCSGVERPHCSLASCSSPA